MHKSRNADVLVALRLGRIRAVLILVALDTHVALADRKSRRLAVVARHALDTIAHAFADRRRRVRAVRVDQTNLTVLAIAKWLSCTAVHVAQTFDARVCRDVTDGFARVLAIGVRRARVVTLRIGAAEGSRRTISIHETLFALAVLLIASRLSSPAIETRNAFGALSTRGITKRPARIFAVRTGQTPDANARFRVAERRVARTIGVGRTCRFAREIPRITSLARAAIGRRATLFASTEHAKR